MPRQFVCFFRGKNTPFLLFPVSRLDSVPESQVFFFNLFCSSLCHFVPCTITTINVYETPTAIYDRVLLRRVGLYYHYFLFCTCNLKRKCKRDLTFIQFQVSFIHNYHVLLPNPIMHSFQVLSYYILILMLLLILFYFIITSKPLKTSVFIQKNVKNNTTNTINLLDNK